jgi:hypothetical protein
VEIRGPFCFLDGCFSQVSIPVTPLAFHGMRSFP